MPTLIICTNVTVDSAVVSAFLKDASKAVARITAKPESYVMIVVKGSVPVSFAGTEDPGAYGELISIGSLGPTINAQPSSTISEIVQTKFSVPSSRFYIKFQDVEASYVGFNGSMF